MGEYEDGESSGYADWTGALLEVDAIPDDLDLMPTAVAEFIVRLDREAMLLANTLSAVGVRPLSGCGGAPDMRAWAQRHVAAGTDRAAVEEVGARAHG